MALVTGWTALNVICTYKLLFEWLEGLGVDVHLGGNQAVIIAVLIIVMAIASVIVIHIGLCVIDMLRPHPNASSMFVPFEHEVLLLIAYFLVPIHLFIFVPMVRPVFGGDIGLAIFFLAPLCLILGIFECEGVLHIFRRLK